MSIIGVITSGYPHVVVLSYCEHGSLLGVLRKSAANGKPVPAKTKQEMAVQVAKGMHHLGTHQLIHRDLAARNVLVSTGMHCKVADFGLSRAADNAGDDGSEEYYRSSSGVFSVRWTAPEAMATMRYTVATDMWSYGIVLYELTSNGIQPYIGMSNPTIIHFVSKGGRLTKQSTCPTQVYGLC